MIAIAHSPILTELSLILPEGFERDQIYSDPPSKWKDVTSKSMMREIVQYFPAWQGVEAIRVGGTQYGDEVIVTGPDPISSNGAIYAMGEMAGPTGVKHWPEAMLRLGFTAKEWIERIHRFGDDYCVCPGSIDDDLGEHAGEYRAMMRALNPGINW